MAKAKAIGADDLGGEVQMRCRMPPPARAAGQPLPPGVVPPPRASAPPDVAFAPRQIFDNLFYVGSKSVGATVVRTSSGLVLIDTLTTSDAAEHLLVAGLKQLGLDPRDIRYVILTHAHGDHHGGVAYLRAHYPQFRVVMSDADWAFVRKPYYMSDGSLDPAPKPPRAARDLAYSGSYTLRVGGTTFHLLETPGHTPGTTSLLYEVRSHGQPVMIEQWGGGDPNSGEYTLAAVEGFIAVAKAAHPSVLWSSHSGSIPQFASKMAGLASPPAEPNPFIDGDSKVARFLDVVVNCKRAVAAETAARATP